MSRIGKNPITLPEKVQVNVADGGAVTVEGPKGKLTWQLPVHISARIDEGNVQVERANDARQTRALHGLSRALVANMVTGVHAGFRKDLEIHGVGFKADVKGRNLNLNLGKSHPILFKIPEEIKITVTESTKIAIEGIDKHAVGQAAADIRAHYPPEPYKGKGVHFAGEQIRRKEGKTVQ